MIINTEEIMKLIHSDVTATEIGQETGLNVKSLTNYRNGDADLGNMRMNVMISLQNYYNEHKDDKEQPKLKITGIRKAVGDFNNWQGAARVYFDPSDMSVWTNVYGGPGEEDYYDDPAITQIAQKATNRMDERDDRITMRQIRELVSEVIKREQD